MWLPSGLCAMHSHRHSVLGVVLDSSWSNKWQSRLMYHNSVDAFNDFPRFTNRFAESSLRNSPWLVSSDEFLLLHRNVARICGRSLLHESWKWRNSVVGRRRRMGKRWRDWRDWRNSQHFIDLIISWLTSTFASLEQSIEELNDLSDLQRSLQSIRARFPSVNNGANNANWTTEKTNVETILAVFRRQRWVSQATCEGGAKWL